MRDRNSGGAVEQTADALYKVVNRTRFETVLHGLGVGCFPRNNLFSNAEFLY